MNTKTLFFNKKRIFCLLLLIVLLLSAMQPEMAYADTSIDDSIDRLVTWFEKEDTLNPYEADSAVSDWVTFCMGRLGNTDETASYRKALHSYMEEAYQRPELLDSTRATEWHRISLALAANNDIPSIDFLADGTFYRGYTAPLNAQGVNGCIWALITLDAMDISLPEDAYDTRESMIETILSYHKAGSGFVLTSPDDPAESCDIDITANAITALAPYYLGTKEPISGESGSAESGSGESFNDALSAKITAAVEDSLLYLAANQLADGSFQSQNTNESASSESCSQILIALTALHIDYENDNRFLKNGKNVLDALMQFQNEDGGFSHIAGDSSNPIASSQAMEALCACKLYKEQKTSLYDLTDSVPAPQLPDGMTHENYRKESTSRPVIPVAVAGGIVLVGVITATIIFMKIKNNSRKIK